jgi:hypothetical protein
MMEHRDDIDRWLYENVGVLPGCCSSIDSLKYNVAREVADKLLGQIFPCTAEATQEKETGLINVTVKVSPYLAPTILLDEFTKKIFTDNIIKELQREYDSIRGVGEGRSKSLGANRPRPRPQPRNHEK